MGGSFHEIIDYAGLGSLHPATNEFVSLEIGRFNRGDETFFFFFFMKTRHRLERSRR